MYFNDAAIANNNVCKGNGQILCVADAGLDKGSDTDVHKAFTGQFKQLYSWGRSECETSDELDGNGNHVCGSVLEKGKHTSQGLIEGTAPADKLIVQSLFSGFDELNQPRLGGIPKINLAPLFDQAYEARARIYSNL